MSPEDYIRRYPTLSFDTPSAGVLRITLDAPGLNAVSPECHQHLADVWLDIDRDPDVRVAVIRGEGKAFSAGGSFELLDQLTNDYTARTRAMREARDIVMNEYLVEVVKGPDGKLRQKQIGKIENVKDPWKARLPK